MKRLLIVFLLLAAVPAWAQYLPLVLDNEITLPDTGGVWDVIPHPDGYYVWVEAITYNQTRTKLYWGRTDQEEFDSTIIMVGYPFQVFAFFLENHDLHVMLSSEIIGASDIKQQYFQAFRICDGVPASRQWHWQTVESGYSIYDGYNHITAFVPTPAPPFESDSIIGIIRYYEQYVQMGGTEYDYGRFIPDMLSYDSTDTAIVPVSKSYYADWYRNANYTHFVLSGRKRWAIDPDPPYEPTRGTEVRLWNLLYNGSVQETSTIFFCTEPYYYAQNCRRSSVAALFNPQMDETIVFTSIDSTGYGIIRSSQPDQLAWSVPGPYDFWFAVECVPGNATEEFLCYNNNRHRFDIFDALTGCWYGLSDTMILTTPNTRVISRFDSTYRRLAFRDRNTIRLYRFGEYLAAGEQTPVFPQDFALSIYPNPFNPSAAVAFDLARAGEIRLTVFDVLGRNVATLASGRMDAGHHTINFDGSDLPSGLYFARLEAGNAVKTQKMVLLK